MQFTRSALDALHTHALPEAQVAARLLGREFVNRNRYYQNYGREIIAGVAMCAAVEILI